MLPNKDRTGVAESGSGYRAAAFHPGTLKKLSAEIHQDQSYQGKVVKVHQIQNF
jgi:hypothetical protein